MHNIDQDIKDMLSQVDVPEHSPDLSERIIAKAMASKPAMQHYASSQDAMPMQAAANDLSWWGKMRAHHGQKMAVAAALAAISIIIFDPAGRMTERYLANQKIAEAERYTVDGIPLLADISLLEETDLYMEEVVVFSDNS
ncbi:MAG: hypothetical protein MK052_02115 [Alphaproteobacteria bacterium]|nr:hypothetical protein [Alphaproteobacteria bacterium]